MSGSKRDRKRRRHFRRTFYCCELCHPPNRKAEHSKSACRELDRMLRHFDAGDYYLVKGIG